MTLTNDEIVSKFVKGATKGKACNMFIEDDILYSFGHHFPLLVRMPWGLLQNADKYSITTSQHQALTAKYSDVLIPFSCLSSAGIVQRYDCITGIEVIDKSAERWDLTGYSRWNEETKKIEYITIAQFEALPKEKQAISRYVLEEMHDGIWEEVNERRPSACVIKHLDKYYLSSMDGANYFLSLLPGSVSTVKEAFEMLTPREVTGKEGVDYLRQGEWFFWPLGEFIPWKKMKIEEKSQYELMQRNGGTGHHHVTRARVVLGIPYVKGTVRHSNRDHRMLKLGDLKSWYMAIESNHVQSWGTNGRVD